MGFENAISGGEKKVTALVYVQPFKLLHEKSRPALMASKSEGTLKGHAGEAYAPRMIRTALGLSRAQHGWPAYLPQHSAGDGISSDDQWSIQ